jgi:indole-3-glycerol phosphate synthase
MSDVLNRIEAYKRADIAERKAALPYEAVCERAQQASPVRGFKAALERDATEHGLSLIAEVKKASPSKGLIREDFNPPILAKAYEDGGASCLSVLTDAPSFQGHDDYLVAARAAVSLPVLRKDFLYDPWQVAESRALGADCILVILASVDDSLAAALIEEAFKWDMDALVEVHDARRNENALWAPPQPACGGEQPQSAHLRNLTGKPLKLLPLWWVMTGFWWRKAASSPVTTLSDCSTLARSLCWSVKA